MTEQVQNRRDECIELPPGFRFHPTDEEIITHYLLPKVLNPKFSARAIGDVDLNKCEPWDLPSKAKMGEKVWYFFCQRDRKYPTGMRTNRATEAGYWKATGKDKEIYRGRGVLVGMKKTLVFYKGRAPKGEKTNWVMHEFRLEGKSTFTNLPKSAKDEWVVCRIFHKNTGLKKAPQPGLERMNSFGDILVDSPTTLPALMDPHYLINSNARPGSSFANNNDENFDFKSIPSFSNLLGLESQQVMNHQMINSTQKAAFYTPNTPPSSYYPFPGGAANLDYLHQEEVAMLRALAAVNNVEASSAIRKHCKMEQYSNQSMGCPSQDTGLSTDRNTEISSVISKHYDDFDDPTSAGPDVDFENMWKYPRI